MAEDGKVVYKVEADDSDAIAQSKESADKISDNYEQAAKKTSDSTTNMAQQMATQYASSIASAVTKAGVSLLKYGAEYEMSIENLTASFTTLLGSADAAQQKMQELSDYAAATPFSLSGVADATKTMLAFQVPAEEVQDDLKMLGDISLGNETKLSGLALVFGQVSSAGKLSGQDLMQFINQGFNPLNYIAQRTGESMTDLRDRMSEGKVSVDEVKQAFVDATSEGGQFYNGTEQGAKTVSGKLSTLKDNASALAGQLVEQLLPALSKIVDGLTNAANWASEHQGMLGIIGAAILGLTLAFAGLTIALKIMAIQAALAAAPVALTLGPILLITIAIAALTAGIILLATHWSEVTAFVSTVWGNFVDWLKETIDKIKGFFDDVRDKIASALQAVIDFVKNNWQALLLFLVNPIAGALALLYNLNPKFRDWVNGVAQSIKDGLQRAIDFIKSLPGQALQWGADFINGMKQGVLNAIGGFVDTVKGLASKVASFLHFSAPDVGPLKNYETWMPDFVGGMAKGIRRNSYKVENAARDLSSGMASNIAASTAGMPTTGSVQKNLSYNLTATASTPNQTINVPLYLNGREIARATAWSMGEQLAWEEL